eukprot:scaffold215086_cov25-Prasinocladus_malaysianus.AAC.1
MAALSPTLHRPNSPTLSPRTPSMAPGSVEIRRSVRGCPRCQVRSCCLIRLLAYPPRTHEYLSAQSGTRRNTWSSWYEYRLRTGGCIGTSYGRPTGSSSIRTPCPWLS